MRRRCFYVSLWCANLGANRYLLFDACICSLVVSIRISTYYIAWRVCRLLPAICVYLSIAVHGLTSRKLRDELEIRSTREKVSDQRLLSCKCRSYSHRTPECA